MTNQDYYSKYDVDNGMKTQCIQDLRDGKLTIEDVPFEFRGYAEYCSAHVFARHISDSILRHDAFWHIANQMAQDIIKCGEINSNIYKNREKELNDLYDSCFKFNLRLYK